MLPAMTPKPRTDIEHRAHLRANVQAAAAGDGHPGEWSLHHFAVHDSPGDFTPFAPQEHIDTEFGFLPDWLTHLAEILGPDHAQIIAKRGRTAEPQPGSPATPGGQPS
jgi:hypothetical protein